MEMALQAPEGQEASPAPVPVRFPAGTVPSRGTGHVRKHGDTASWSNIHTNNSHNTMGSICTSGWSKSSWTRPKASQLCIQHHLYLLPTTAPPSAAERGQQQTVPGAEGTHEVTRTATFLLQKWRNKDWETHPGSQAKAPGEHHVAPSAGKPGSSPCQDINTFTCSW